MRALAEFAMRGRMQATLVVAGSAVVPLLFWLSAAAGSLVLLRRGFGDAFGVLAWAVLPAMFWWYLGDPSILLVLLGTLTLAQILRARSSWSQVLLASVVLGVVFALVLGHGVGRVGRRSGRCIRQGPAAGSGRSQAFAGTDGRPAGGAGADPHRGDGSLAAGDQPAVPDAGAVLAGFAVQPGRVRPRVPCTAAGAGHGCREPAAGRRRGRCPSQGPRPPCWRRCAGCRC